MPSTSSSASSTEAITSITPLLPAPSSSTPQPHHSSSSSSHPLLAFHHSSRALTRAFLSSRAQHFIVLSLVTLDLLGIFADIFINLYICEEKDGVSSPEWDRVRAWLGGMGLVFSCLFMVELILSVWAFGWRYFASYFHTFDAIVIAAGFIVDVLLHGVLEEVASLVIILRLWRFFKIFEEFISGAQEQMDGLELRIRDLEAENGELKGRLKSAKRSDEEAEVGVRG